MGNFSLTVLEKAESLDVIAVGEPELQFVDEDLVVPPLGAVSR